MTKRSQLAVSAGLPDLEIWTKRALWLAGLTIAYNVAEGIVAIGFGWGEESVSLFGFGIDSLIEVGSASLVMWRFRGEQNLAPGPGKLRERRATLGIGCLFVGLALVVAVGAVLQVVTRAHPETTVPGIVVAALSLAFMGWLWRAKRRVAEALNSATVAKDASCSLVCLQLSAVVLAGSVTYALLPVLWWADAVAALLLAVFIAREGVETIRASRREDFDGGCGCSH